MSDEAAEYEGFNQSNDGYSDASLIQFRLDTGPMLDNLEAFFRGRRITGSKETKEGVIVPTYGSIGKPKMNNEGIQSLLSWLTTMFSPHTVQGNKTEEEFIDFMVNFEVNIKTYVMINLKIWDIRREDYSGICDLICHFAEMFFSRTIDNKERERSPHHQSLPL